MLVTTALEHFKQEIVIPLRNRVMLQWEQVYQQNRERLKEEFIRHFAKQCQLVLDMQNIGEHGAVGHFTYSLLRTQLLEGKALYLAEAADETWLFDPSPIEGAYDASWAFGYLDIMLACWKEELERPGSSYTGSIAQPELERLLLREAEHGHAYVTHLIHQAMPEAVQCESFINLEKCPAIEVRVGEYLDVSESVYKTGAEPADEAEIRKWLAERTEEVYGYAALEHLDLAGGDYSGMDFRFSAFRDVALGGSQFENSNLVNTVWEQCDLTDTRWNGSQMYGARFRNCRMVGALFHGIEARKGMPNPEIWDAPGFNPVSFAGADLREADFILADLQGADFREASFENTVFGVCNLADTDFRGTDVSKVDFTGSRLDRAQMDLGTSCRILDRPAIRIREGIDHMAGMMDQQLAQLLEKSSGQGGKLV
ncbi:uncharacterized protein YjbI with pentapeptide repeats [Paenibacillus amylolyticus]|uniref:Uncharacterized protein YjbI with pentapeptide repeats n=1 Tax=Paenibacillus amylolyticus TaxID=1451 RepID=A0AAP5H0W1_PAEAM|nr:pentapeptide repeat-containing protein [Paenibacillus amylolyticus]MDR6723265.1 uncharacterized protein YjbI with pentapeptide repeats [Paenibacillus amylolyticus]